MAYLILGVAVLAVLIWAGRRPGLQQAQMRLLAGAFAALAFVAAAFVATRGQWLGSAILLLLSAYLAPLARKPPVLPGGGGTGEMSDQEARSILGVGPQATKAEIDEAYRRLMRRAHPDQGGTSGLASKLNAARDRLLR
ncbi:MAG TPA: DnaJ domain-containing protein [Caulobacteraceae bacterium]|nr:DnaJ domain-containing protein [Caulobacteraceae bacterium]